MVPLLRFLRESGVVPAPQVTASPAELLVEQYRSWMESERGLSASTVLRYDKIARGFLAEQAIVGGDSRRSGDAACPRPTDEPDDMLEFPSQKLATRDESRDAVFPFRRRARAAGGTTAASTTRAFLES
jgi:hypothetical protein